jgi:hypothetical protein
MEYQVLIFSEEGDILSSQHYDNVPGEELIDELLVEDKGVKAEVYIVDGDEYSKHLFTYDLMF